MRPKGLAMTNMDWAKLLCDERLGQEPGKGRPLRPGRSEFNADLDRIIFSGAFRRLARKTQVHPLVANDHVHTRLTHSLEASRVGRTLGMEVGLKLKAGGHLPEAIEPGALAAIVEAACAAHDIGNPPFGHGGERSINHWFEVVGASALGSLSSAEIRDISRFEGNAQGFRVLTQTENHLFSGGLRLTFATLATFLKYPWTSEVGGKFSVFRSESRILDDVAAKVGLVRRDGVLCRHPLAYLVEAADDICYSVIDLEDAVELQIVQFDEVKDLLLSGFDEGKRSELESSFASPDAFRVNLSRLRGAVFDILLRGAAEGFVTAYEKIMVGDYQGTVFDSLKDNDHARGLVREAKRRAKESIFPDRKKVEIELGSYAVFDALLSRFCPAAVDAARALAAGNPPSWRSGLVLKLLGDHAPNFGNAPPVDEGWSEYQCVRRAMDFVSGMTDNYATYVAQQVQGLGFAGGQRP